MVDGVVIIITHFRWICPNRRKQSLVLPLPTFVSFFFFYYRRMSWVDDDPEDVVNTMQASVWGGEFLMVIRGSKSCS